MPLLRQNLGDQHWTCILTTICAMLLVLMRPAHRRQTNASVLLSFLLHLPHERMPRRIRPPRRLRLPRHMSGPTRQTHVRLHNQDETRVRTHRRVASQRSRAAKRRDGGTWHFARAMRSSYRLSQRTQLDRVSDSWRLSWILELRRASRLPSSFQDLWSLRPCPRHVAATVSQMASASQTLASSLSISRQTKAFPPA